MANGCSTSAPPMPRSSRPRASRPSTKSECAPRRTTSSRRTAVTPTGRGSAPSSPCSDQRGLAGNRRRIFAAHAAHLRRCGLRSSLTHQRMRSLRCSAAPSIWAAWTTNLSPTVPTMPLEENLKAVRQRIARAGRDPDEVAIVAVTKGFGPEVCRQALDAGLEVLGENRVQEALEKMDQVEGATWHLIG